MVQAKNKTWTVITCEATSNQLGRWCLDVESGKYKELHGIEEVCIPYEEFSGLPSIWKSGFSSSVSGGSWFPTDSVMNCTLVVVTTQIQCSEKVFSSPAFLFRP